MGDNNGHSAQVESMIRDQQAREQAQRQLEQMLHMTMQSPSRITRLNISLAAIVDEDGRKVLLVALPSGERIEIPMPAANAQKLAEALASSDANN
jgi:hypothetical protein